MSNSILPHLLSDTPPPLVADDEEFEDEFGDFKGSEELSFDNDNPSTPSSLKNPNEYFPDSYTDFNSCNVEENYRIFETPEDKSTTSFKNAIPSSNYFTLWEQIENNIPEIIDNDDNVKETISGVENVEEVNNISTHQSNENLQNSGDYGKRTDIEIEKPCKSTKEETTENLDSSELYNSFEIEDSKDLNLPDEDIPLQTISEIQIQSKSNFVSKENSLEKVLHTQETDERTDFNIEESKNETIKIEYRQISGFISDHSVYADNASILLEEADNSESDSKNSNVLEEVKASQNLPDKIAENQESEDDFGEFADFTSSKIPISATKSNSVDTDDEEDFYEFESYQISCTAKNNVDSSKSSGTTQEPAESKRNVNTKEIEEFDSFNDFASYSEHAQDGTEGSYHCESHTSDRALKICKTPEEAFKETQNVLENIFTSIECTIPDYSNCEYIMNNSVFENLKDITETNALTYQWCKSVAQKNILRTLNIDIRNILYGPTWNSGMPIFAPNLCSKPLEPTRSELPIPISPQKVIESQETTMPAMPQFDWSGSGLPDLQDSSVNADKEFHRNQQEPDGEFGVIQPIYIGSEPIQPKVNNFDEELTQSRPMESINTVKECQEIDEDFSDFTSYQESIKKETKWKNMLPLRESHISSNVQQDNLETDKISIYFQELTMGKSEAIGIEQLKTNPKITNKDSSKLFENELFPAESLSDLKDFQKIEPKAKLEPLSSQYNPLKDNASYLETDTSNSCARSIYNFSSLENEEKKQIKEHMIPNQRSIKHQEDEFTDFQSSLPCPSIPTVQPALLEPLKPAILQPQSIRDKRVQIEWPDPGLDEQEINRIVNGVLRKNSTNENIMEKTKNLVATETDPNKTSQKTDHDDWSDFISVKEPLKSRTSTPDLPLSVFNLGSIQPVKACAPFITPNGVIHSPSRTPNIGFPVANRNLPNGTQQHTHQQPFITSQAFNALYSNNMLMPSTPGKSVDIKQSLTPFSYEDKMSANRSEQNFGTFIQSGTNYQMQNRSSCTNNNTEDDDWGDFVSAPNTISHSNSSANFFQPLPYSKTNLGFRSNTAPTKKFSTVPKNTVVKQERNNFPVISTMPDLDFVSPKSKSTIK